ncbi:MAG TPA: regulator SirB [Candidatus Tenderia electrophaga]|uniref:Regulator SirB n=1 Tax=Candidatus Tenderia electrophaga TaxID=1748243 RepID=A0A832J2U3_9GAMM|nr:regulator SirB [Candidatus Tenderia electrophaga]
MEWVKIIHVSCALLSITGFITRGILMMRESVLLQARLFRIAPHIIDTLLLATAIWLAVKYGLSPGDNPWLMAKIIALLLYIGLGTVALKRGKTKQVRIIAWLAALLVFAYIVAVAVTKSAMVFV